MTLRKKLTFKRHLKIEKEINGTLLEMKKQDLISDKIYQKLRTTGAQPARLYGLAKVHKNETPLRPVLSIPGSSYHNLNKFLTPLFEKVPGANIETSTLETRKKLEMLVLDGGWAETGRRNGIEYQS